MSKPFDNGKRLPTRRELLEYLGVLVGAAVAENLEGCKVVPPVRAPAPPPSSPTVALPSMAEVRAHSEVYWRREDMVLLDLSFVGLWRDRAFLRRFRDSRGAFLIVRFAPQVIGEQSFRLGDPAAPPGALKARIASSQGTQLVFKLPDSDAFPYDLDAILGWAQNSPIAFEFRGSEVPSVHYTPEAPSYGDPPQTAIEIPLHIYLTPLAASWRHAKRPVTRAGRSELWTTRLVPNLLPGEIDANNRLPVELQKRVVEANAMWTDEYGPTDSKHLEPYLTSFTPFTTGAFDPASALRVRKDIVQDSCNAGATPSAGAKPLKIDDLRLSALGGWLKIQGEWQNAGTQLEAWRHVVSQGRDQFAEVLDRCYLYPFGHRASLVSQTTRDFETVAAPNDPKYVGAYLRTVQFILVRQPEVTFTEPYAHNIPHPRARIQIERTPPLGTNVRPLLGNDVFVPLLADNVTPFAFPLRLTDHDGIDHDVVTPLVAIKATPGGLDALRANRKAFLTQLNAAYETFLDDYQLRVLKSTRRYCDFGGRRVAYAPSRALSDLLPHAPNVAIDPTLETAAILFGASLDDVGDVGDGAAWRPAMVRALVTHPGLSHICPTTDPFAIEYLDTYAKDGFADLKQQYVALGAFAKLTTPLKVDFSDVKAAAASMQLATPSMLVQALSALRGPLSFLPASGSLPSLDLGSLFKQPPLGTILGGVALKDILGSIPFDDHFPLRPDVPGLTTTLKGDELTVHYHWKAALKQPDSASSLFDPDKDGEVEIDATIVASPTRRSTSLTCSIRNFSLRLLGRASPFISVHFNEFRINKDSDSSPRVTVGIDGMSFSGALKFINDLAAKVAGALGGGGLQLPRIAVEHGQITLDHAIGIGTFEVPGFAFSNVSFLTGIAIPLDGTAMRVRFGIAEREHPFLLAFGILGGGGFFTFQVRPTLNSIPPFSVELVEGALEFGGTLGLNLGVADGEVHALVGIYFRVGGEELTIRGYIRCGGSLNVLGLIHISVEFYLSLSYDKSGTKQALNGQASMTVSIDILFFSASVTLEVHRCIELTSGACAVRELPSNTRYADATQDWQPYWQAFA